MSETDTSSFQYSKTFHAKVVKRDRSVVTSKCKLRFHAITLPLLPKSQISSSGKEDSNDCPDVFFWRAVATQRASELDCIREEIEKIELLTKKNILEKQAMDKKHDELYNQLQSILENSEDPDDSGPPEDGEQQPKFLRFDTYKTIPFFQPQKEKHELRRKVTPAIVIGKENQETQATVEVKAAHVQTVVTTIEKSSPITKEDLLCEEPTSSYWRVMAERLEKEIDIELETSFNKSLELDRSYEDLEESNRLYKF
ncbi:hypothetical protein OSTOST_06216 [Ostertagia ostertagi]